MSAKYLSMCYLPIIPLKSKPYNTNNFKTTSRIMGQAAYIGGIFPEADFKEDIGVLCWGIFSLLFT